MKKKILSIITLSVFVISTLAFSGVNVADAAKLTQNQINAIIMLLQSFGAPQNVILNVQSALSDGGSAESIGVSNNVSGYTGNANSNTNTSCIDLQHNMWIGKSDKTTNGEVSKLQRFLIKEGAYPEAIVSGYYGKLTALAVVR